MTLPPSCKECRYYHRTSREWCLAPQLEAMDLVMFVRFAPSECGEEGKWFNPLPLSKGPQHAPVRPD